MRSNGESLTQVASVRRFGWPVDMCSIALVRVMSNQISFAPERQSFVDLFESLARGRIDDWKDCRRTAQRLRGSAYSKVTRRVEPALASRWLSR
jgi:hypothetical protein